MTTTPLTKAAVDKAEPLAFPERKPARADLTITIRARIDGFDTEICFTGAADQLLAVTKRLREIGAGPASGPVTTPPASTNGKQKTANTAPVTYDDSGTPHCGIHKRAMKESSKAPGSWYCTAKDGDAYCKERA
jgi:hypothetical protein